MGVDKAYDTRRLAADCRDRVMTPPVAQNTKGRRSAIDGRTTRYLGDTVSQRFRKRVQEIFGWMKTGGGGRKLRYIGLERNQFWAGLTTPPITSSAWPGSSPHPSATFSGVCTPIGSGKRTARRRIDGSGSTVYSGSPKRTSENQSPTSFGKVGNPGDSLAVSVHLYGPRVGEVDGRDYDLSRDYVCDRRED